MTASRAALDMWTTFVPDCEVGKPWHQHDAVPIRAACRRCPCDSWALMSNCLAGRRGVQAFIGDGGFLP